MGSKCKLLLLLLVIAVFIVIFLFLKPSIYYSQTIPGSTDTDTDTKPLDTLKRTIAFYERLDSFEDEIKILEKDFQKIEEHYETQIQPNYNKKLQILHKIEEQMRRGERIDTVGKSELYEVDGPVLKFRNAIGELTDKYSLLMDSHDSLQSPLNMILEGLVDLYDFGLLLFVHPEDNEEPNKTLPTSQEKAKMTQLLSQLLEGYLEIESNQEKIREIMGTKEYTMDDEGDMMEFQELLAKRPELNLFKNKYVLTRDRMDEIIKKNKKFLQYALPYCLLEMNAKFDRIENVGNKLASLALQWNQNFSELHSSKKELQKKLEIAVASLGQKNATSEKKTEL